MDYKEKYEQALSRARQFSEKPYLEDSAGIVEYIFPELAENEDEKIRKEILLYFTSQDISHQYVNDKRRNSWTAWLEKQGEQKPADKIEPKFKVGDWIICCNYEPVQIISIRTNAYEMSNGDIRPFWMVDNNDNIRLWTIKNAKPGDVLRIRNLTFIFQEITNNNACHKDAVIAYCSYEDNDNGFGVCGPDCITGLKIITPATKEQHDALMKAMADAGYTFDFEKKELKKIEQKPEHPYCQEHCKGYKESGGMCYFGFDCEAKREAEKKPSWSEEDEKNLEKTIWYVEKGGKLVFAKTDKLVSWLKSLKDKILNTTTLRR